MAWNTLHRHVPGELREDRLHRRCHLLLASDHRIKGNHPGPSVDAVPRSIGANGLNLFWGEIGLIGTAATLMGLALGSKLQ